MAAAVQQRGSSDSGQRVPGGGEEGAGPPRSAAGSGVAIGNGDGTSRAIPPHSNKAN